MRCQIVAWQSGKKGGTRMVSKGVRMEVLCVMKWRANLRGKSRGVLGEGRSYLKVKPSQVGGESGDREFEGEENKVGESDHAWVARACA